MSAGYFSRLLQRARGESGGIRPVVPALFAAPDGSPDGIREMDNRETTAPASGTSARVEQPFAGLVKLPRLASQPAAEGMEPAPVQTQPPQPLAADARTPSSQPGPQAAPGPARGGETSAPTTASPAPRRAARTTEVPLIPLNSTQPAEPSQPPARPPTEVSAPQVLPAKPPPVRVEALLLPVHPPNPLPSGPETSLPAREDKEAAAPAVRISIGRIEVRAVQPPAAVPAARPEPHPAMSLEEYLRRLNEEER